MNVGGMSLARQYALMLTLAFIIFEALMAAAVVGLLMMPMARRAAGDLAGLMVLSAQTWSELPPETRPAFELEMVRSHGLRLRAGPIGPGRDELHGPYLRFLEAALANKTGVKRHLVSEIIADETWYWTSLPSGEGEIAVGLSHDRVGAQPAATFLASLAGALLIAMLASVWLARRAVEPLASLEAAAQRVGRGEVPELLSESGPRELAGLARRFNEMARQVNHLLAARTTLLAGVSHDLRSPLARMRVALTLLEERPTPKLFGRIEADLEEMDRMIGNVLDLARGLDRDVASVIDLRAFLNDLAGEDGRVSVDCPSAEARVPPLALRRVIGNLLDNARRHAPGGLIQLVVELQPNRLQIGVLDRGPGIDQARREESFEPFHRLDGARNPATGGAGLGLAIVRQLAEVHGWTIELASRSDGAGLAAWVVIPIGSWVSQDA
ncbi:MAG: HAMP domain-containing protein [Rhodocyclaceae bacterium]|nr:HAMP domain-containing protein [Rhodocyclaceae bacterium]